MSILDLFWQRHPRAVVYDRYFFDTEFHDDGISIEPISLGIVDDSDRALYMEFDFDEERVRHENPWVAQNVLPLLRWPRSNRISRADGAARLADFCRSTPNRQLQFWAYNAAYDWTLVCQLFGGMTNLPDWFPHNCMDLKQVYEMLGNPDGVKPAKDEGADHNALFDARKNRQMYAALRISAASMPMSF